MDTAGNGVFQPNETVVVAPTWRNTGAAAIALTGALANHTGPAGPTYTIPDGAADYGTIAVAAQQQLHGDRQLLQRRPTPPRRVRSRTGTARSLETVTPTATTKTWTLHIGDSFTDVPAVQRRSTGSSRRSCTRT